jgi:hypothetical protein
MDQRLDQASFHHGERLLLNEGITAACLGEIRSNIYILKFEIPQNEYSNAAA